MAAEVRRRLLDWSLSLDGASLSIRREAPQCAEPPGGGRPDAGLVVFSGFTGCLCRVLLCARVLGPCVFGLRVLVVRGVSAYVRACLVFGC